MSDLNKLKELVKLHTREFDLHKADPRSPSKLAAWDYASSLLNDEIDRDAVGLVTQILGELEAAQQRIAELEADSQEIARLAGTNAARAQKAEAELARRDASAGEPVAWQVCAAVFTDKENATRWAIAERHEVIPLYAAAQPLTAGEPVAYSWKGYRGMNLTITRPESWKQPEDIVPLYAAQPSALPPEIDSITEANRHTSGNSYELEAWMNGANWMREQAKALGCKAISPVVKPGTKCIGWVRDAIHEHDEKWIAAVVAAGFIVEGE